jgi:DNA-binding response OmpR family regulator
MPSVLVVDDEANIRELVTVYFTAAGFDVCQAADGPSAIESVRDTAPDLVILDIMLPGVDGATVCRRIRETSQVPIIMLTARDTDLDKVSMLEAGADDYMTKPFSPSELVARARAIMRRTAMAPDVEGAAVIEVGVLRIDPAERHVTVDGVPVELTAKEFDLLAAMAAEPGVVFTRERLLERAWGFSDYVDPRGIDVHIRHLRTKLGDDAVAPRFVETVRGVGYRVKRAAG